MLTLIFTAVSFNLGGAQAYTNDVHIFDLGHKLFVKKSQRCLFVIHWIFEYSLFVKHGQGWLFVIHFRPGRGASVVTAYSSTAALVIESIMSNEHNGKDGGLIMVIVSIMSVMANMVFCWSWSLWASWAWWQRFCGWSVCWWWLRNILLQS